MATRSRKTGPDGMSEPFTLQPGQDPAKAVERIYRYGRSYGDQQPHSDTAASKPMPPVQNPAGWELDAKGNSPGIQCPEDRQAPGYQNDTSGWLRGFGKPHPYFDGGGPNAKRWGR